MKKLLTNWAFILASCIMVVSAFTDCAPVTKSTLKNAKEPRKNYQVTSVDSAFYTNQNEVIVYYKVSNKDNLFDYRVVLDFNDSSNLKHEFMEHYGTWRFKNKAFRKEPKGEIAGSFEILNRSDSIDYYYKQMREQAGLSAADSFAVLHVVTGKTGYPGSISPIYFIGDNRYRSRLWTTLPIKRKFRKTENYLLLPITVVPDIAINMVIVAGAILSIPVIVYQAIKRSTKDKNEKEEVAPRPLPAE